jgi:hypothetical protein
MIYCSITIRKRRCYMMGNVDERGTAVIEARLSYKTMAALHRYFVEEGAVLDLIWQVTETLLAILKHNGKIEEFESIKEAWEYMQPYGARLEHGGRGRKKLVEAIQREEIGIDNFSPVRKHEKRSRGSIEASIEALKKKYNISDADMEEAGRVRYLTDENPRVSGDPISLVDREEKERIRLDEIKKQAMAGMPTVASVAVPPTDI